MENGKGAAWSERKKRGRGGRDSYLIDEDLCLWAGIVFHQFSGIIRLQMIAGEPIELDRREQPNEVDASLSGGLTKIMVAPSEQENPKHDLLKFKLTFHEALSDPK